MGITCYAVNWPEVTFKNCRMLCHKFCSKFDFLDALVIFPHEDWKYQGNKYRKKNKCWCWWSFAVDVSCFVCVKLLTEDYLWHHKTTLFKVTSEHGDICCCGFFFTRFKEKKSKSKPCLYVLLNSKAWEVKRWKFRYFFGWMHSDNWEVNWSLSSYHPCLFWFLELCLLHEICFYSRLSVYLFFCLADTVLHVMWYKGIPGLSICSYLGNLARISFENSVCIRS